MTQFTLPTQTTVAHPRGWGYGARLDDLLVRLVSSPERRLNIESAKSQAQRVQTEANAEDFVPEYGQVFSRADFSGGEGLDFAHEPGSSGDPTRFWDSKGITVFQDRPGELRSVELLPETDTIASTGTDATPWMVKHPDGYLLRVDGNNVLKISDPTGTPGVSSEDPFPSYAVDIEFLCQVGTDTWATGAGASALLSKRNAAGTWTELATALNITSGLWYVKSRLIGAVDEALYEINESDGTAVGSAIHTLPAGEAWKWAIEAGPIVLAAGGSQVFVFQTQSGVLTLVNQTKITDTDEPVALAYAAGVVLVGTREAVVGGGYRGRLYRAAVGSADAAFALTGVQLLRTWEPPNATNSAEPRAFFSTRDSIYMTVREGDTEVNLWRYYLPTGGIARNRFLSATGGLGYGSTVIEDLFFVSVGNNLLIADTTLYVTEGYVITPLADHFTAASKSWLGITSHVDSVGTAGEEVQVYYTTDPEAITDPTSAAWIRAQIIRNLYDSGVEIPLTGAQSRWLAMMAVLHSNTAQTISPKLRSIAVRSFTDSEDVVVDIPISISDRIERPGKRPITVSGWGDRMYQELMAREGGPVIAEIFTPPTVVRGTIEAVGTPIVQHPERGSAGIYAVVRIRGRLVTTGAVSGGGGGSEGALGIGTLGIGILGV